MCVSRSASTHTIYTHGRTGQKGGKPILTWGCRCGCGCMCVCVYVCVCVSLTSMSLLRVAAAPLLVALKRSLNLHAGILACMHIDRPQLARLLCMQPQRAECAVRHCIDCVMCVHVCVCVCVCVSHLELCEGCLHCLRTWYLVHHHRHCHIRTMNGLTACNTWACAPHGRLTACHGANNACHTRMHSLKHTCAGAASPERRPHAGSKHSAADLTRNLWALDYTARHTSTCTVVHVRITGTMHSAP